MDSSGRCFQIFPYSISLGSTVATFMSVYRGVKGISRIFCVKETPLLVFTEACGRISRIFLVKADFDPEVGDALGRISRIFPVKVLGS